MDKMGQCGGEGQPVASTPKGQERMTTRYRRKKEAEKSARRKEEEEKRRRLNLDLNAGPNNDLHVTDPKGNVKLEPNEREVKMEEGSNWPELETVSGEEAGHLPVPHEEVKIENSGAEKVSEIIITEELDIPSDGDLEGEIVQDSDTLPEEPVAVSDGDSSVETDFKTVREEMEEGSSAVPVHRIIVHEELDISMEDDQQENFAEELSNLLPEEPVADIGINVSNVESDFATVRAEVEELKRLLIERDLKIKRLEEENQQLKFKLSSANGCQLSSDEGACSTNQVKIPLGNLRKLGKLETVFPPCLVRLVKCDAPVPKRQRPAQLVRKSVSGKQRQRRYECDQCLKTYLIRNHLNIHKKTHRGADDAASVGGPRARRRQRYQCGKCPKSYYDKGNLIHHKKLHLDKNCFRCSTCGKRYDSVSGLVNHRKIHLGVKPFKCSQCGRAFVDKYRLLRHSTSHTDEKPYRCSTCGKRYGDRTGLNYHTRVVALCKDGADAYLKKEFKKPRFPCATCGRSFVLKEDLENHVRYHREESVERALGKKRRQR